MKGIHMGKARLPLILWLEGFMGSFVIQTTLQDILPR